MTLVWRRRKGNANAFPWFVSTVGDGRTAIRCAVCPCGFDWYINTVCSCGQCQPFADLMQCGEVPAACDGTPSPGRLLWEAGEVENNIPYLVALMMTPSTPFSNGQSVPEEPIWTMQGSHLTSIRAEISPPFAGTATATLYVDGEVVSLVNDPFAVTTDTEWAGPGTWLGDGADCAASILLLAGTGYEFKYRRAYNVDLKISYVKTGEPETTAEQWLHRPVLVWGFPGGTATINGVYVTPFPAYSLETDDCNIRTSNGVWGTWNPISTDSQTNLGPYRSDADAEYVIDRWGAIIGALAYCKCFRDFGDGGVGSFGAWIVPDGSDWGDVEGIGGADDATGAGPNEHYAALTWGIDVEDTGWSFRWKIVHANATVSYASANGQGAATVPPCESWSLQSKYTGEGAAPTIFASIETWPLENQEECQFDDEESQLYGIQVKYSPVNHLGIPSNSAELADFLAWENSAKAACAAAGGTWNDETLSCDLPEE